MNLLLTIDLSINFIRMSTHQPNSKAEAPLAETHFNLDREHGDDMPYPVHLQIDNLVDNIKFYVHLLIQQSPSLEQVESLKALITKQLELIDSDEIHTQKVHRLREDEAQDEGLVENTDYLGYRKVEEFGEVIKKLMALRADTEEEDQFERLSKFITGFLKEMEIIVLQDNFTIDRLEKYEVDHNNIQDSCESNDREVDELPPTHSKREQIGFRAWQPSEVFDQVEPPRHRDYISQVTKVYHEVVPFKIKFVNLSSLDDPKINTKNYYNSEIEVEKAVIHYCVPGTKKLITYRLDDICKLATIEKEYATQVQLPVSWAFSELAKTITIPDGRIFGINCRSSSTKIDSSLYEISAEKVSNRGRVPDPKRNSSIIYCNKALYVVGGNGDGEKCSARNFKFTLKDKKWKEVSDANVALRKPTLCAYKDRYILKIGGINEFDYINKVVEIYDTTTDRWSIVRASAKNVQEEVQILQDSLAVQISDDQIYVFGGKNNNNFRSDTGLVLQIMEIREKIKAPAKVSADLWNVSIGKKNVLSFFGLFSQPNVVVHNNCIYAMRAQTNKLERV